MFLIPRDAVKGYVTDSTMADLVDLPEDFLTAAALDNQSDGDDTPFSKPKFMGNLLLHKKMYY